MTLKELNLSNDDYIKVMWLVTFNPQWMKSWDITKDSKKFP